MFRITDSPDMTIAVTMDVKQKIKQVNHDMAHIISQVNTDPDRSHGFCSPRNFGVRERRKVEWPLI